MNNTEIIKIEAKEEILYVAEYVSVVNNPRGYKIVRLSQDEMNQL